MYHGYECRARHFTDGEEHWLPVVGYEGLYEVSSHGRVRSYHRATSEPRVLKANLSAGYRAVNLSSERGRIRHTVHSLVARAFIGPRPPGAVVHHRDHNKQNNRAGNLEYTTHAINLQLSLDHRCIVAKHRRLKLTRQLVTALRRSKLHSKKLAKLYRISPKTVGKIRFREPPWPWPEDPPIEYGLTRHMSQIAESLEHETIEG